MFITVAVPVLTICMSTPRVPQTMGGAGGAFENVMAAEPMMAGAAYRIEMAEVEEQVQGRAITEEDDREAEIEDDTAENDQEMGAELLMEEFTELRKRSLKNLPKGKKCYIKVRAYKTDLAGKKYLAFTVVRKKF